MLLIGSQALRINMDKIGGVLPPSIKRKGPSDLDFFANGGEAYEFMRNSNMKVLVNDGNKIVGRLPDGLMCEIEIARAGSSTHLYLMWTELYGNLPTVPLYGTEVQVAPLEMLFSIKKAHRHSPRKFEKHVHDYNFLRTLTTDSFPKVTSLRYKETKERDRLFTPSLKKTSSEFFDDKVSNKTFIHDQIHEVMAFGERPMFEKIRISPDTVACSVDKWNALEPLEKIQCVQEEAYVIALERGIIPMLFEGGPMHTPLDAYKWAVMRICTTLTSGWFREWALENYQPIIWAYDKDYVQKFLKAVDDGKINRIQTAGAVLGQESVQQVGASETRRTEAVPHGRSDNGGDRDHGSWPADAVPKDIANAWEAGFLKNAAFPALFGKHPGALSRNAERQLGTLGTGNHFIEVCTEIDNPDSNLWVVIHSGSRGFGNRIGSYFTRLAGDLSKKWGINLPNKDLGYFPADTDEYREYIVALLLAQRFAWVNREIMMARVLGALELGYDESPRVDMVGHPNSVPADVHVHHNYADIIGNTVLTRKGAVDASAGKWVIIPGSMGAKTYIGLGLGNRDSHNSCSHGAGRAMSRGQALKTFSVDDHVKATEGVYCDKTTGTVDETPLAYKDIDAVMESQRDLVEPVIKIKQLVCVKGISD